MPLNINTLIGDMKKAATDILKQDISTVRGFSERQLKAIAQHTALVEQGIASGEITEETRDFFLDSLEDMVENFVNTLRGLITVVVEKLWNAIVGVLWKAIETTTGIGLSLPAFNQE